MQNLSHKYFNAQIDQLRLPYLPGRRVVRRRIARSKLFPAETPVRERKGRAACVARYRGRDGGHGCRRHRTDL